MDFPKRTLLSAISLAFLLGHGSVVMAGEFAEILDTPAMQSELAIKSQLIDVALVGKRLVTVGQRGHILYSDDAGKTWRQSSVPLSADLLAVYFPTATDGWAVGHAGAVLHSTDAGVTWSRQLDGRQLGQLMLDHYSKLAAAAPENAQLVRLAEDAKFMLEKGEDSSFLDVWFENDKVGYLVGSFNLILRTDDGGLTWVPVMEQTENPNGLHLNAISKIGDNIFIVGEQGLVLKLDRSTQQFVAVPTPYNGTYFGLVGDANVLMVYGLRGNVYRSVDAGASWSKVDTGLEVSITAATVDASGHIYLFSQAGQVLLSTNNGVSFAAMPQTNLQPVAGAVATGANELVLVGGRGARLLSAE